ncbi:MAG TPA: hypothetical protein VF030_03445 [Solirubrobacterales bacterium]
MIGAAIGLLLAHRLVGFRTEGPSVATLPGDATADRFHNLALKINQMQAEVAQIQDQLRDRELMEERKWRLLDETQKELQQRRRAELELRYDLSKRLDEADEARRLREREFKLRQKREFERHRERELEESLESM